MAEAVPPIHILSLEHDRIALANYDVNRDRIVLANVPHTPQNIVQFSNLFNGEFVLENIMAINGPAFTYLLNSEGMHDLKSKLFGAAHTNYNVNELVPEQLIFLTMFYHIHCLAYIIGGNMPSIQNTFTEKFRKLVEKLRGEQSSQMLFGQNVAPVGAFFNHVQRNLIDDERHHITFSAFLEILEGGAEAVQNYINEGHQRFTANNNSTNTQASHFTSNTRRGLNAISNPSFNNDEDEGGPEPGANEVVFDEDARSARSQPPVTFGTGKPSNYSVAVPSTIKSEGSIILGNLAEKQKAPVTPTAPNQDPELLELRRRLESLDKPTTAKVPPAAPAAPLLPPAISAALKKGAAPAAEAGQPAPPVLRNSKGRPVRSSLKKPKPAANIRETRRRARFPTGNRGTVEEITYSKEAPPSGVITNTENVLRGTVYPTYRSLGRLESRRKTGAKPEPPYVPGQKKKKE